MHCLHFPISFYQNVNKTGTAFTSTLFLTKVERGSTPKLIYKWLIIICSVSFRCLDLFQTRPKPLRCNTFSIGLWSNGNRCEQRMHSLFKFLELIYVGSWFHQLVDFNSNPANACSRADTVVFFPVDFLLSSTYFDWILANSDCANFCASFRLLIGAFELTMWLQHWKWVSAKR